MYPLLAQCVDKTLTNKQLESSCIVSQSCYYFEVMNLELSS